MKKHGSAKARHLGDEESVEVLSPSPVNLGKVFFFKQTNAIQLKFPQASFGFSLQTFSNKVRLLCYFAAVFLNLQMFQILFAS